MRSNGFALASLVFLDAITISRTPPYSKTLLSSQKKIEGSSEISTVVARVISILAEDALKPRLCFWACLCRMCVCVCVCVRCEGEREGKRDGGCVRVFNGSQLQTEYTRTHTCARTHTYTNIISALGGGVCVGGGKREREREESEKRERSDSVRA